MKEFIKTLLVDKSLYEQFKSEFTFHSSAIEGSTVSKEDNTKILLMDNPTNKELMIETNKKYPEDEVQENFNLGVLFDYMIETLDQLITERETKIWHNILMRNTLWSQRNVSSYGKYKGIPNEIDGAKTPQPHEIPELMSKFIAKLNKLKKYTLEDICKIHCEFEIIHPFLDGNGRIGRILMLRMCLLSNVYPFIINHETREEYLSCIKMYRKTKSSGFLVEYCHKLQIIFIQKFNKFLKDIHVTKIMNWFKTNKTIKRSDVEQLFNIGSSNAKKILTKLMGLNLLQRTGDGPSTYYTLK